MEIEIKHVNFFDGQFLQQSEFIEEQLYHIHMRRRLYLALFEQDGVVPVTGSDLTIVPENPAVNKSFHVRAGMAISLDLVAMERKEIILRQDSAVIDLTTRGFPAAGPTAWVAINFEEQGVAIPPSAGDVPGNTRIIENAAITVHSSDPTGTTAPNGHPFIILGSLTFATMAVDVAQRQTARIRAALIGAGGGGPALATIQSIDINSGQAGTTVNARITGTNLSGASAVNFTGPGVTASIVSNPDAQTVNVAITITAGAAAGPRTFTVVTPQGTADSTGTAAAAFSVSAVVTPVVVASFSPTTQATAAGTNTISVRGTNIRNAGDAIGTIVRFVDPANPATVFATSPTVTFQSDAVALQRVSVVIPQRTAFTPTPASGSTLQVLVQVEFNGVVGNSTTNLAILVT